MSLFHIRGTFPLVFNLIRASGNPSDHASFVVSTEGSVLSSDVVLGGVLHPLEFCLGVPNSGTVWGPLTFPAASAVSLGLVSVRAKATTQSSLPSGNFLVEDFSIDYSISVNTNPSISVSYDQSAANSGSTSGTSELSYYTFSPIMATYNNYDLLTEGPVLTCSANWQISLDAANWSTSISLSGPNKPTSPNQGIFLSIRTPRNRGTLKSYPWKVYSQNGALPKELLASGSVCLTGRDFECQSSEGMGKPGFLEGVVGRVCSPTSFRLFLKKHSTAATFTISAPSGFRVSFSPDGTDLGSTLVTPTSQNLSETILVYVYLDPLTRGENLSGNITVSTEGPSAGPSKTIPVLGRNSAAPVVAVVKHKNLVTPTSSNPVVGVDLVYEPENSNPVTLTGFTLNPPQYSFSPFYFDSSALPNVQAQSLDLDSWSLVQPSTPGIVAVKVSWPEFTDPVQGLSFAAGQQLAFYNILPGSTSSPVYYGAEKYIEIEKVTPLPLGYSYSPPSPILKNVSGFAETQPTIYTKFLGTESSGQSYESVSAPNFPGSYSFLAAIPDKPAEFYFLDSERQAIPHGLVTGSVVTAFSSATNPITFSTLNYDPIQIPSEIFVDPNDPQSFNIRKVSDPTQFLKFAFSGDFLISVNQGGSLVSSSSVLGLSDSTIAPPNSGDTIAYAPDYIVQRRAVSVFASSDNIYPATGISTSSFRISGVLSSDSISVSALASTPENFSGYFSLSDNEPISNPNDTFPNLYYGVNSFLSFSGSPQNLSKYLFPERFSSSIAQVYRKALLVTRPELSTASFNVSRVYDGSSWYDYDGTLSVTGVEAGDSVIVDHALSAFDSNPSDEPIETGSSVRNPHHAFPEVLLSGADELSYLPVLSDHQLAYLTITPKELSFSTTDPNLQKTYDGTPEFSGLTLPLVGAVGSDEVFVSSLLASSKDFGSDRSVVSANLNGRQAKNYTLNINTGWSASANISIAKRSLSLSLTASKVYNGLNNPRIPLVSGLVGADTRLRTEPICYGPLAPIYSSSSVGSGIASTSNIAFFGGDSLNYSVSFVGSYDGSDPTGPLGTVVAAPLVLSSTGVTGTKVYNGSTEASQEVQFSLVGAVGTDSPTKADFNFTATLANPNRGLRACQVSLLGFKNTSPYFGNYIVSNPEGGFATGAITITPKLVGGAEAASWLVLDGVSGGTSVIYKNQNPTVSFNVPETPLGTTPTSFLFEFGGVASPEAKIVGSYKVRLLFPGWDESSSTSNYRPDPAENAEYVLLPFSVQPRPLTVTSVTVPPRNYGSTNWPTASLAYVVQNEVPGVTSGVGVVGTYTSGNGVFVPSSQIQISYSATNPNFTVSGPSSIPGVVAPKTVTVLSSVDVSSVTKVYDGTTDIFSIQWAGITPGSSPALGGVLAGDETFVSVDPSSFSTARFLSRNAGPRGVVANFTLAGSRKDNYNLTQPLYEGQIDKKVISFVGLHSNDKIFDGLNTAFIINNGFEYTGIVESDTQVFPKTAPIGVLNAYFTNFNFGTGKQIRLKGLLPPTPNYVIEYLPGTEDELAMPERPGLPYQIYKRTLKIKPKDFSKFFGDLVSQEALNLSPDNFFISGLVPENQNNPINPATGKSFGDEILNIDRVLENGYQQNTGIGILPNVSYAINPIFKTDRGSLSNYDFVNGQTDSLLKGSLVIENVAFKNLTKTIKEAIWEKECTPFGCKDLNWFELVGAPNRFILAVDYKGTVIGSPPEPVDGQKLELQQSTSSDPEVLVSEG